MCCPQNCPLFVSVPPPPKEEGEGISLLRDDAISDMAVKSTVGHVAKKRLRADKPFVIVQ